jgi:nucleoside-diphosphate-sugar epimerase
VTGVIDEREGRLLPQVAAITKLTFHAHRASVTERLRDFAADRLSASSASGVSQRMEYPTRERPMNPRAPSPRVVLVTGSFGLIGAALSDALRVAGYEVRGLDLRAAGDDRGDVLDRGDLARRIDGCVGVVHLAAVSRVIEGERDPERCWRTNVDGTAHVLDAAARAGRPWVLYASSREVYGQPETLPANEHAPLAPVNVYGRSKVEAEGLVRRADLATAVLRFSNVYGATRDYGDRVIPAFARQAALGLPLRVDGSGHTFDFTHLDDTVRGVAAAIRRLEAGQPLAPLHLVTGSPTTLGEAAALAMDLAGSASAIREAPPRSYDVEAFVGDPWLAAERLGWRAEVSLRIGLERLIRDFRALSAEVV